MRGDEIDALCYSVIAHPPTQPNLSAFFGSKALTLMVMVENVPCGWGGWVGGWVGG